ASGSGNGQGIDSWISNTKAGGAQPSVTLNLFDWAAKLGANRSNLGSFSVAKYGPQQATDPYNSNWGNGVHTDGTNVTGNDPNDRLGPKQPARRAGLDSTPDRHLRQFVQRRRAVLHAGQRARPVELDAPRHPPRRRHADRAARPHHQLRLDGQVARPGGEDR